MQLVINKIEIQLLGNISKQFEKSSGHVIFTRSPNVVTAYRCSRYYHYIFVSSIDSPNCHRHEIYQSKDNEPKVIKIKMVFIRTQPKRYRPFFTRPKGLSRCPYFICLLKKFKKFCLVIGEVRFKKIAAVNFH